MNESREHDRLSFDKTISHNERSKYFDTTYMTDPGFERVPEVIEPASPLSLNLIDELNLGHDEIQLSRSLVHPCAPVLPNIAVD